MESMTPDSWEDLSAANSNPPMDTSRQGRRITTAAPTPAAMPRSFSGWDSA